MPNDASINGISEKGITYKTLVSLYVERLYKKVSKKSLSVLYWFILRLDDNFLRD